MNHEIVKPEMKTSSKNRWLCLSLITLCATAAAEERPVDSPSLKTSAVWVAPFDTAVGTIGSTLSSGVSNSQLSYFTVAAGVHFPVGTIQLGLSGSFTSHMAAFFDDTQQYSVKARGGALTAGPIFHPFSRRGWFVQPKIVLGAYWARRSNSGGFFSRDKIVGAETWSIEAAGGLNVGFERNFGPFYLAFTSGVALGYSSNRNPNAPFSGLLFWSGDMYKPTSGILVNVDLNFLRLGVAF